MKCEKGLLVGLFALRVAGSVRVCRVRPAKLWRVHGAASWALECNEYGSAAILGALCECVINIAKGGSAISRGVQILQISMRIFLSPPVCWMKVKGHGNKYQNKKQ